MRIEIPEKLELSFVTKLMAFLTALVTCCLDIGSARPLSVRKLANSGGQCGHRAAGFRRLVHSAETSRPRSAIILRNRRTIHNSRVDPLSNLGYNPFQLRSCLRFLMHFAADPW